MDIIKLRIEYAKEMGELFSDNLPKYADWLEKNLAKVKHDNQGYRLLIEGEQISYGDEYLDSNTFEWKSVSEYHTRYNYTSREFLPMRRKDITL